MGRSMTEFGSKSVAVGWCAILAVTLSTLPGDAAGQNEIPDIDYENLSFRGIGLDWGRIYPDRVEPTSTYAVRFDLGYAGPGLRIVPSVTYWRSPFEASEMAELESRFRDLVRDQTGLQANLDLGSIEYTDIGVGVDGHVVWELPLDLLTYGGMGVTAHFLNGDGDAINGTFIEDLLDSVTGGFNLHLGTEYPVTDRMRIYSSGRYEVMPDLRYFRFNVGLQFMTGPNAPGEGRGG